MKRSLKILLMIPAVFALFIFTICAVIFIRMNSQVKSFDRSEVDVSQVKDGIYEGRSETDMVKVDVKVTVSDGDISDIEIVRHECGKGKIANVIVDDMVEKDDVEVDAVSGATFSSEVIKDAVRSALRKGR
ncbi:MAG: FMN-binding protein [Lachnospiraceae bacterium]|nr:FMN-binding protein [Lachnospiraceae bacterium]